MKKTRSKDESGGEMTRVCFVVDKEIYRQLRIATIRQDKNVSEIMREAARNFIAHDEPPKRRK